MIHVIVCDDEKEFRKKVVKTVDNLFIKNNIEYEIKEFSKYDKQLEQEIENSLTSKIYILDIEMPNSISGIDIARKIRKTDWNSIIIIVTSHLDSSLDALKAQIMLLAFLSKYDECEKNLTNVLKKVVTKVNDKKVLLFETNGITHRIYLDDIIYITFDNVERKSVIQTTYGPFFSNKNISDIAEELNGHFFQTHRGFVINTEKISTIDWKQSTVYFRQTNNTALIARDKKKGFKKFVGMG